MSVLVKPGRTRDHVANIEEEHVAILRGVESVNMPLRYSPTRCVLIMGCTGDLTRPTLGRTRVCSFFVQFLYSLNRCFLLLSTDIGMILTAIQEPAF